MPKNYARHVAKFKDIEEEYNLYQRMLADNAKIIDKNNGEYDAVYLVDKETFNDNKKTPLVYRDFLIRGGWVYVTYASSLDKYLVYFTGDHSINPAIAPTVSPDMLRMPKLSFLITMTPDDFFKTIRVLAEAKPVKTGSNAMTLNFPAAGIHEVLDWPGRKLLEPIITNWRIDNRYAMKQWIKFSDLKLVADLEPNYENQLFVMQYLTALTQKDLEYFPLDVAIELAQEWDEIDENYVRPPSSVRPKATPDKDNIKPWLGPESWERGKSRNDN